MYEPKKFKNLYTKDSWITYSPKLNRNVCLHSELEYDYWVLVETNPKVLNFCEHPTGLVSVDMWVLFDNEEYLVEVKYSDSQKKKESDIATVQENSTAIRRIVMTENEIRSNSILLSNMKIILGYIKNRNYPLEIDKHIVRKCLSKTPISLSEIERKLPNLGRSRITESIIWMIYNGMLMSNLDLYPFGPETEVWLYGK